MTDFDAKLAELESQTDRVPELKMVVELLRMLGQQAGISAKSMPIPTSEPMPGASMGDLSRRLCNCPTCQERYGY
jgi:hypothetical protein